MKASRVLIAHQPQHVGPARGGAHALPAASSRRTIRAPATIACSLARAAQRAVWLKPQSGTMGMQNTSS